MRFTPATVLSFLPLLVLANETPLTEANTHPTAILAELENAPPAPTLSPEDALELELRRRQAPGQIVGEGVASAPTQQSPTTTYLNYDAKGNQVPFVYTQLFSAVPDQWDQPKSGAIGLGDIKGEVGVVKTRTKRGVVAEATAMAKRGLGLKIFENAEEGPVEQIVDLEKRARKGGSGGGGKNNTNDAGAIQIPTTLGLALLMGFVAREMW